MQRNADKEPLFDQLFQKGIKKRLSVKDSRLHIHLIDQNAFVCASNFFS